MKWLFKLLGFITVGALLVFIVALIAIYRLIHLGELQQFVAEEIERQTRLKVTLGSASFEWGRETGVSFRDFVLVGPEDPVPLITAEKIFMRVALWPALRRQVDLRELQFHRPTVRLTRGAEGRFAIQDVFFLMLKQRQRAAQVTLDVREIETRDATVVFVDQAAAAPTPIYLRDFNLRVARRRGADDALEFAAEGAVEKGEESARFASSGTFLSPAEGFDLRRSRVEAEVRLIGIPIGIWRSYYSLPSVKSARGTLTARLDWKGSWDKELRVGGRVDFEQLSVEAPEIFAAPLAAGSGQLNFEIESVAGGALRLPRLDFRSKEISFSATGSLSPAVAGESTLDFSLTTPFISVATAKKYLPASAVKNSGIEEVLHRLRQGEFKLNRARLTAGFSEFPELFSRGFAERMELDADFKAIEIAPKTRHDPLWRGWSGKIEIAKSALSCKGLAGFYGSSRVIEADGRYEFSKSRPVFEARIRGEANLAELRSLLEHGFALSAGARFVSYLDELDGKSPFAVSVRGGSGSIESLEGKLTLDRARLRVGDVRLSQLRGVLAITPKEIRLGKMAASAAGSPVTFQGVVRDYLTDRGAVDLTVSFAELKSGILARLLFAAGSAEDPGTARGTLRYRASLSSLGDGQWHGQVDLVGAQLPLFDEPFREVDGRLRLNGRDFDIQGLRGAFLGSRFEFGGEWRSSRVPQLLFQLTSPNMDLGLLLDRLDGESSAWYDRLQAKGTLDLKSGKYDAFEFSEMRADLTLDKKKWRVENLRAQARGGGGVSGSGTFTDDVDRPGFTAKAEIQGVPFQEFLRWFDLKTGDITGGVNLAGQLESAGADGSERRKNMSGSFHLEIQNGVVRRFRALVLIFNLLDLSRWFSLQLPDVNQQGVRFRKITGDFKVSQGIYATENFFVDSDDLRISGAGKFDGAKGEVDMVVAVRPFPGLDTAVSYIPLIGQGLAAIKNSLLVASFRIRGPIHDPVVTPAPLSTLSEFFFGALAVPKSLLGLPGEEKK
jgi:hypothetical protein